MKEKKGLSQLEQLAVKETELYTKLGQIVYRKENEQEQPLYAGIIEEINAVKEAIEIERKKEERLKCKKCGAAISENAKFCSVCGERVQAELGAEKQNICPSCGVPIKGNARFCVSCGARLQVEEGV